MKPAFAVLETNRAACIADAITTLERALVKARAGNVIAVAVTMVEPDLSTHSVNSRTDNLSTLIGGVAINSARLIAAS